MEKGSKCSIETRKRMSEAQSGERNPMYGRKHKEETRRKISLKRKGQHNSPKTEFKKGHKESEETRRRKSESRKGEKNPRYGVKIPKEEHPMYGRTHTKEAREKIKRRRTKQVFPIKDTSIEVKIQNFLKTLGIEYFTHQYMKIEHGYQCDILIPSMNLVIECDGDFIHCNPKRYSPDFVRFPNSKNNQPAYVIWERDKIRTKELIEKGFKVLRLWEFEINEMSIKQFEWRVNKVK